MNQSIVPISKIFQIALAIPLHHLFDYFVPEECCFAETKLGVRVLVPFGKHYKVGFLLAKLDHSEFDRPKLKPIIKVLDVEPLLTVTDIDFLKWVSHYYHHPLGEVLTCAFPTLLRQGKPASCNIEPMFQLTLLGKESQPEKFNRSIKQQTLLSLFKKQGQMVSSELKEYKDTVKVLLKKNLIEQVSNNKKINILTQTGLSPNQEQKKAIDAMTQNLGQFSVTLLAGVTGSGKTEVYMQVIHKLLIKGQQVLVLLPEITLTPQLEQRFRLRFNVPIVSFHSKLSDKERLNAWLNMQTGHAYIMLGTRSALFTPLKNPGLIIMDEEHDSSFKQQEGFRFSARDVAIARAKKLNIPVLLGSATPSLESLFNAQRQRYQILRLSYRAGNAVIPSINLLDIRNKKLQAGLSENLIKAMQETLAQGEQVLLFLNRRGFAPVQICHSCGWVSKCVQCDANMVIHAAEGLLRCHHCARELNLPKQCPVCQRNDLHALGMGTERIEQTLTVLFPNQSIVRLDKDTTKQKGSLEKYLGQIKRCETNIILGTQMLAKGHDFPNVTLVAILDIDSGLFSIDFRAGEKLAQTIIQVAGRAGRASKPGKVILQTRHPHHPLLNKLLNDGYAGFAQAVLEERSQAQLPPFSFQALFRAHANNDKAPQVFLLSVFQLIEPLNKAAIKVYGPVSAPMAIRAGQYRYQLLLQTNNRQELHGLLDKLLPQINALKSVKKVRWSLDVDPFDLY